MQCGKLTSHLGGAEGVIAQVVQIVHASIPASEYLSTQALLNLKHMVTDHPGFPRGGDANDSCNPSLSSTLHSFTVVVVK